MVSEEESPFYLKLAWKYSGLIRQKSRSRGQALGNFRPLTFNFRVSATRDINIRQKILTRCNICGFLVWLLRI